MMTSDFAIALRDESIYPLSENIVAFLLNNSETLKYAKNQVILPYDSKDDSIYFVKDGIIRGTVVNGAGSEITVGFGVCGTMFYSSQCYTLGLPSIYQFIACTETQLYRIKKSDFDRHIDENHEFCRWIMGSFGLRICYNERRNDGFNANATEKYMWLLKERPEIIQAVNDKVLASYLGISCVHLSRIKANMLKG